MSDQTYNGWKNYETWAVGMYLDGNYDGEGTYRDVLMRVEDTYGDAEATSVWTIDEARKFNTADMLKDYVSENLPTEGGLAGDLLGAALSEVDWDELAEHKLAEVAESIGA